MKTTLISVQNPAPDQARFSVDKHHIQRDQGVSHPEGLHLFAREDEQHAFVHAQRCPVHEPARLLLRRGGDLDIVDKAAVGGGDGHGIDAEGHGLDALGQISCRLRPGRGCTQQEKNTGDQGCTYRHQHDPR